MKITIGDHHIDINDDFIKSSKSADKFADEILNHNPKVNKEILSEKLKEIYKVFHPDKGKKSDQD